MRLTFLFILIAASVGAQSLSRFQVGVGFGGGIGWPTYDKPSSSSALLLYIEPSWRISSHIALGFKAEMGLSNINIGSYGPLAMYHFSNKTLRSFAGVGVGLYHPYKNANNSTGRGPSTTGEQDRFGIYPRVGVACGHFALTIDYNLVPIATVIMHDDNNPSHPVDINPSYLAFKLGVNIGGGRRKSD